MEIISVAERLSIIKKKDYTLVTIRNPWQGAEGISETYCLVERGKTPPEGCDSAAVIFVPLGKIVCMSTTHLAMLEALGAESSVKGISGTGFIYSPVINSLTGKDSVKDVGYEGSLNKELILKISPDLVMMYGIGNEANSYTGKLRELGVRVLFNADYLETKPLGKAEWIKLFGALYCMEALADSIFSAEQTEYENTRKFIGDNANSRPSVLLGLPYRDIWYISPGNSYVSTLIEDAGGRYLWAQTVSSVSMPYGIENVYLKAAKADFWLNIGTVRSKREIVLTDSRLAGLPSFKAGNLYNNTKRVTPGGGNDYWETGALYPHIILKDIASILNPDLFPGYEQVFYSRIN